MIPFYMKCPEQGVLHVGRKQFRGCQGLGREWGEPGMIANGYGVSSCGDENALESDSGDGCTTLWIH